MRKVVFFICLLAAFSLRSEEKPVTVFSFPKSGTHFILELYYQLTQIKSGLDHPHHYGTDFSLEKLAEIYGSQKFVFLIRDPRDAVVSYMHWVDDLSFQDKSYYGGPDWDDWTAAQKIEEIINGHELAIMKYDVQFLPMLHKELKSWTNVYCARFEDFIGPRAGGNREKQLEVIYKLAQFMTGRELNSEEVEELIDASFGQPGTFRNPTIGKWKRYFTDEHKRLFKESIWGEVLVDLGYETDQSW